MWEEDYARKVQRLPHWSSSLWEREPTFLTIRDFKNHYLMPNHYAQPLLSFSMLVSFSVELYFKNTCLVRTGRCILECDWAINFSHYSHLRFLTRNRHSNHSTSDAMLGVPRYHYDLMVMIHYDPSHGSEHLPKWEQRPIPS